MFSGLIMKEKNITVQTSKNIIFSYGLNIKPCFANLLPISKRHRQSLSDEVI